MKKTSQSGTNRASTRGVSAKEFQRILLQWFERTARDLPWRTTHDPYHILVSELMLQQTQVDRVIPKYVAFLAAFPTVDALARAPQASVVRLWQGLGYNRRALYLQRAAQMVVNELDGQFPNTASELQKLPGVGPYTAGAIASFAFHSREPIVDTNVERVIGRIFFGYTKMQSVSQKKYWEQMQALLPLAAKIWSFNQALMDFGAITCTAAKPDCSHCPFQKVCVSYPAIATATPAELRYKKQAVETQYYGKPRRIWRGKVLKFLHEQPLGRATLLQIGKAIQPDFVASRSAWLRGVVRVLEKDGLVELRKDTVHLAK